MLIDDPVTARQTLFYTSASEIWVLGDMSSYSASGTSRTKLQKPTLAYAITAWLWFVNLPVITSLQVLRTDHFVFSMKILNCILKAGGERVNGSKCQCHRRSVQVTVQAWYVRSQFLASTAPTIQQAAGGLYFRVVRPAVRACVVLPFLLTRSSLRGRISMKPGTSDHRVSDHCWTGFQGQMSKVKVTAIPNALLLRSLYFEAVASSFVEFRLQRSRRPFVAQIYK